MAERLQDDILQYLVKWKGLPYSEATWESIESIHSAGGQDSIDEFQVGAGACLVLCGCICTCHVVFAAIPFGMSRRLQECRLPCNNLATLAKGAARSAFMH